MKLGQPREPAFTPAEATARQPSVASSVSRSDANVEDGLPVADNRHLRGIGGELVEETWFEPGSEFHLGKRGDPIGPRAEALDHVITVLGRVADGQAEKRRR